MKNLIPLTTLLLFATSFLSCNKSSDTPIVRNVQVDFSFSHHINGKELIFDSIMYLNAKGNPYSVSTLKYFISDIRLNRKDGTFVHFDMEHYVDARDEMTTIFRPDRTIAAGEYTEVTFIFGIDSVKNVNGRFPDPPENLMEWPPALGEGYHYMKLEGKLDSAGMIKNYQAHSGPSKGNHYYFTVILPNSTFQATDDQQTVEIAMNINHWWDDPNTLDLNQMTMVMGNLDMQKKLQENGANVFSFGGLK
jgi:hypothetical protein